MKLSVSKRRMWTLGAAAVLLGCLAGCKSGKESTNVTIDEKTFPDAEFRRIVSTEFDLNSDGKLSPSEINAVTDIDVSVSGIHDLKGIELFSELAFLDCSCNYLAYMDVSHNGELKYLRCYENRLMELDVSKNPELVELDCRDNQLETLDVSKNPELFELTCSNNQLTSLDVTENPRLQYLLCEHNHLTELDTTKNLLLRAIYCDHNQLDHLDVTHNPLIGMLGCTWNRLKELDVSKCSLEIVVDAGDDVKINNEDKEPDKGCPIDEEHFPDEAFRDYILQRIDKDGNRILSEREANSTGLISLDSIRIRNLKGLEYFPLLVHLEIYGCELTELDLSANTYLSFLSCIGLNLTELDLSKNSELTNVWCNYNELSKLDISGCERLWALHCQDNQLKTLDCSNNRKLVQLDCSNNPLTDLDIRNASKRLIINVDPRDDLVVHTPDGERPGSSFKSSEDATKSSRFGIK